MSLFENTKMEDDDDDEMIQIKLGAEGINRNFKRKFHPTHQSLDVPKPKQACLKFQSSQGDSNSFSEDADSVMSVSINDQPTNEISSPSSSVNWTKTCDEVTAYNLYPCPSFKELEGDSSNNTSDYTTKQLEEDDDELEDLLCPDGVVISNNYVLSSGRWNIIQDTEQGTEELTIDKEFEQYFSMLML